MKSFLKIFAVLGLVFSLTGASHAQSRNFINNSGNGIGNTIVAQNFGGGHHHHHHHQPGRIPVGPSFSGQFGGGLPGGFPGVNVNVITNSGNGVGNTINTSNSNIPGGVNVNVITNSGNGAGNVIRTSNRR